MELAVVDVEALVLVDKQVLGLERGDEALGRASAGRASASEDPVGTGRTDSTLHARMDHLRSVTPLMVVTGFVPQNFHSHPSSKE